MANINEYDSDSSTLDSEDGSEQETSNTDTEQDQYSEEHIMKSGGSSEDEQDEDEDSVDDDDNDVDVDDNVDDDVDDDELKTSTGSNKLHAKSVIQKNNHNSNNDVQELNLADEILEDDEEIRAFLASGKIKPGCTYKADENIEKEYPNCVSELKQKLKEIRYKGAWLERMDITGEAAPMAPEMQMQIREERKKLKVDREVNLQNPFRDMSVLKDDFEREVMFQRHAQAAVLLAIPRLHALGVRTHRPEDFFGQMVKTDEQMQKVRTKLQEKLLTRQASEHNKKLNKLRKFGKKVQTEVLLSKAEKKREMMKKIKQYRQGQISHLDFLNDAIGGDDGVGEHGGLFSGGKKKRGSINKDRSNSRQALTEMLSDGDDRVGRGGNSFRSRGGMSRGRSGSRGGGSFRGRGGGSFRGRGGGSFRGRGGGSFRGRGGDGSRVRGGNSGSGSFFKGRGGGGGSGGGAGGGGFRGRGGGGGRGGQKFRGGAKQRPGKDRRKSSN